MRWSIGLGLAAATSAAVLLLSPPAPADPGSPSSYDLGKQTIDSAARQHPLQPNGDLAQYCDTLLKNALATGKILRVDSPSDFITGCQDEGRAILSSQ